MNTITIFLASLAGIVAFAAGFAVLGSALVTVGIFAVASSDVSTRPPLAGL